MTWRLLFVAVLCGCALAVDVERLVSEAEDALALCGDDAESECR